MALAQYSDTYWFPTGTLAASVPARVFQHNTNTLATLWSDAGGTVPLANPVSTSAGGVLEFWAEEGRYWVHIDSEAFEIAVGSAAQTATQQDITNHTGAADPHADRAYADGKFATIVVVNTLTGTVTTLSGQVANLDMWVQDALARVAAIEQGTAFLAGAHYVGPVDISGASLTIVDGQLIVDSSGTGINAVDRGGTANFGAYVWRTAGVDRWAWQQISGSQDLLLTDSANGIEVMRAAPNAGQAMLGFLGATPVARQAVTGSRAGNAALASFLQALDTVGLIDDQTTA
ncbi:hypothetical protein [Streptomyces sp. YKOK-I1]